VTPPIGLWQARRRESGLRPPELEASLPPLEREADPDASLEQHVARAHPRVARVGAAVTRPRALKRDGACHTGGEEEAAVEANLSAHYGLREGAPPETDVGRRVQQEGPRAYGGAKATRLMIPSFVLMPHEGTDHGGQAEPNPP
jgi:hypothetical protein